LPFKLASEKQRTLNNALWFFILKECIHH